MIFKRSISFFRELGETTVINGISTCKSAINRINSLISSFSGQERFKALLNNVNKNREILRKECIIQLKEKLLLKNERENTSCISCPKCGLALPSYYVFCVCCGTQLFDDILNSESSKLIKFFPKSINHLFDVSILLDNLKLLLFLFKRFDKCLFSLTGCNNRV